MGNVYGYLFFTAYFSNMTASFSFKRQAENQKEYEFQVSIPVVEK